MPPALVNRAARYLEAAATLVSDGVLPVNSARRMPPVWPLLQQRRGQLAVLRRRLSAGQLGTVCRPLCCAAVLAVERCRRDALVGIIGPRWRALRSSAGVNSPPPPASRTAVPTLEPQPAVACSVAIRGVALRVEVCQPPPFSQDVRRGPARPRRARPNTHEPRTPDQKHQIPLRAARTLCDFDGFIGATAVLEHRRRAADTAHYPARPAAASPPRDRTWPSSSDRRAASAASSHSTSQPKPRHHPSTEHAAMQRHGREIAAGVE